MSRQAGEIARFLGAALAGSDLLVDSPSSLTSMKPGSLVFAKALTPERVVQLNACPGILALVPAEAADQLSCSHVIVSSPRLAFARVVQAFFVIDEPPHIASTAVIAATAVIAEGVSIGNYSTIGAHVRIGEGTRVRDHVVIASRTTIGRRCLIKSHAVLGEEGFGFEIDEAGSPVRLPHLGTVEIGDDVEVGVGVVIARATLDATRIGNRVKLDDMVFLAHNCSIGDDSMVIAAAEVSGSVRLGKGCWIGPQAALLNGVTVGDRGYVGLGAVVTKPVAEGSVVVGNPAKHLRDRRQSE